MKRLCWLMALLAICIILPACSQGGADKPAPALTITVVTPFNSEDGNRNNFVSAYKAYEEATGHTVKDEASASNEEWKAKIMADFSSGNEPDILFYFTGTDADQLIQSGRLVLLSDIRKAYPAYAANMKDSLMPVSTYNGRQYAVPVNGYWEGLFVNKKVLAACGLALPGDDYTWESFLADCQTIKDTGYIPIACSLAEIPHYWFEYAVFNNGGLADHLILPSASGDKSGQNWAAGLRDIRQLYERGFFPPDTNTLPYDDACQLMLDGAAAFMIDGSWKTGWFQANAANIDDFTVTYVPAKGQRQPTDIIGGLSMGYYITKKAWDDPRKQAACVAFVSAMTSDEVVSSFGALSVTALKEGAKPPQDADTLTLSALAMTKNCTAVVAAAQDMLNLPARKFLFAKVPEIVQGSVSPEEAIDSCLAIE